jgi:hypothetical protein
MEVLDEIGDHHSVMAAVAHENALHRLPFQIGAATSAAVFEAKHRATAIFS